MLGATTMSMVRAEELSVAGLPTSGKEHGLGFAAGEGGRGEMTVASIPVLGSTIETQFMRRPSYSLISSHQAVVAVPTRSLARLATPSGHKIGQRGLAVVILWSPMRKGKPKVWQDESRVGAWGGKYHDGINATMTPA